MPVPVFPSGRRGPDDRPGTFDFLGFTHYWAVSLKGYWVFKLKTAKDRLSRAVRSIDQWCYRNRHLTVSEQQQKLNQKLRGMTRITESRGTLPHCHGFTAKWSEDGVSGLTAATVFAR
ncbi:MAG: hypothetical protein ACPGLY_25770 [Rubripirellula sp.]